MPLLFFNNSTESTGSILYGRQLNRCRLYYRHSLDEFSTIAFHGYRKDALKFFMNMSKIVQHNQSTNVNFISSEPEKIKFCHSENIIDDTLYLNLYPGEQFTITVVALDQGGSPVPAKIFNENNHEHIDKDYHNNYRLSPSSHLINSASCTNISFQIFSPREYTYGTTGHIQLYPEPADIDDSKLCHNLIKELSVSLSISLLHCPLGLKLSQNHQCSCDSKLSKFSPKCYAYKSTNSVGIERTKKKLLDFSAQCQYYTHP